MYDRARRILELNQAPSWPKALVLRAVTIDPSHHEATKIPRRVTKTKDRHPLPADGAFPIVFVTPSWNLRAFVVGCERRHADAPARARCAHGRRRPPAPRPRPALCPSRDPPARLSAGSSYVGAA